MKRPLKIPFAVLLILLSSFVMAAMNTSQVYTFTVYKCTRQITDHEVDVDPEGQRAPSRPVSCTVSPQGGVEIAGYSGDIISYGICDAETEACLASFADESDFVSHLLTLSGEYQIRFETPDCLLVGYIYL